MPQWPKSEKTERRGDWFGWRSRGSPRRNWEIGERERDEIKKEKEIQDEEERLEERKDMLFARKAKNERKTKKWFIKREKYETKKN